MKMQFQEKPLISVIVPIYNVEQYIHRCIDSIINQSYKNIEIILVDDGSPDNCPDICDQYKNDDSRVVVLHKENGGLSSARNAGIQIAQGSFVTFVDSDDYILPDMVEQLVITTLSSGCSIAICRFTDNENQLEKGIINEYKDYLPENAIREILVDGKFYTSACAKLYDMELFNNIRFPIGVLYEDYGTLYKILHIAKKISFIDVAKYYYTFNDNGITKSPFSKKQMDYFLISDEVESFMERNYPNLCKLVQNRSTNMAISLFLRVSIMDDNSSCISEKMRLISIVKNNSIRYLLSKYPATKKISAILISIAPNVTEKLMKIFIRK